MEKYKVTVITLTYNNWDKIHTAINSLARQIIDEHIDMEYLIVDDGTEGFNIAYVQELVKNNLNVKSRVIINEKNLGTVKSFNNAIKQSKGDYIIPLSADDEFYSNDVINKIMAEFINSNADIVTAKRMPYDDDNSVKFATLPNDDQKKLFNNNAELLEYILKYGSFISGACTYYRKSHLVKLGFFDEEYVLLEDYPFLVKTLLNGVRINYIDIIAIKYRLGGVSSIMKRHPLLDRDFRKLYKKISEMTQLNLYWRRRIFYFKVLSSAEKIKILNIIKYPEQFMYFGMKRIGKLLRI
ncbi:glycosyltransferase [Cronobacter dublinensis]|uniref:Glycosyltransferase n=1 Tax=Cronobacter dublinensis TaxID=413497 RepID=A0A9Q4XNK7_9ENTR|nr:glycosyltransferase [Cronobacter dublinensis]NCH87897.1 glycosyltransferase [Cronobacter dublinensis]